MKRSLTVALLAAGVCLLGMTGTIAAAPIYIYGVDGNLYQNSVNNPCVFYGPGGCSADPEGWPTPVGDTNQDPGLLVHDFVLSDWTAFAGVAGSSFLVGLDTNQTGTAQILYGFAISFDTGAGFGTPHYSYTGEYQLLGQSNGSGFADFVLAAGCLNADDAACAAGMYEKFLVPVGTLGVRFTLDFAGNDGPDKVFLVNPTPAVPPIPEPASLLLLGSGLLGLTGYIRRRRQG